MRNDFISPRTFPSISELTSSRSVKLRSIVNNIKYPEVNDDDKFQKAVDNIKKQLSIEPVVFGEAEFIDYTYEEVPITWQQAFRDVSKDHYLHKVSIPYTGSRELFSYMPMTFTFSSADHGVLLPGHNSLTVYADLPQINPQAAITEARKLANMTFNLVEGNNSAIIAWSNGLGFQIDEMMKQKREELTRIFGNG